METSSYYLLKNKLRYAKVLITVHFGSNKPVNFTGI